MSQIELEMQDTSNFNLLDALVGVILRPARTMKEIAAARPWLLALGVALLLALLNGFVTSAAPEGSMFRPRQPVDTTLPDGLPDSYYALLVWSRSPWLTAGITLIMTPLSLTILSGVYLLVGRLFRGEGRFTALIATLGFATVPNVFLIPIMALLHLGAGAFVFEALRFVISIAFWIWMIVLQVLGIRASLSIETGQAVAVWVIPFALLFLLACAFAAVLVAILFLGLRSLTN